MVLSSEIALFPRGIYVKCQAIALKGLDILVDVIRRKKKIMC